MSGSKNFFQSHSTVEVLIEDLEIKQLPTLPIENCGSTITLNNGTFLLCGGLKGFRKCIQFDHGTWKNHSTLNRIRDSHSAIATQLATFLFGGYSHDVFTREDVYGFDPVIKSHKSYEYLPNNSNTWLMGKNEIPGGFYSGCAIASKCGWKIWMIGGLENEKRILSFDVKEHTFQELPFQLNVERWTHRCAYIPNTKKIMITGGRNNRKEICDSTEIWDTDDGSVTMASPMNIKRAGHGMGTVTINGEDRLAVFGGNSGVLDWLDSVELYNAKTKKWETTTLKLKESKASFALLEVKLGDIIS